MAKRSNQADDAETSGGASKRQPLGSGYGEALDAPPTAIVATSSAAAPAAAIAVAAAAPIEGPINAAAPIAPVVEAEGKEEPIVVDDNGENGEDTDADDEELDGGRVFLCDFTLPERTRKRCLRLIAKLSTNFAHVPPAICTPEFEMEALQVTCWIFNHMVHLLRDEEHLLIGISADDFDPIILRDMNEALLTQRVCVAAVRRDKRALEYIPVASLTPEVVQSCFFALKYVPVVLRSEAICVAAARGLLADRVSYRPRDWATFVSLVLAEIPMVYKPVALWEILRERYTLLLCSKRNRVDLVAAGSLGAQLLELPSEMIRGIARFLM